MTINRVLFSQLPAGFIINAGSNAGFFFMCKSATLKTGKNQSNYLDIDLFDGVSSCNGKVWSVTDKLASVFTPGKIVFIVAGYVSSYQGNKQIVVEAAREAAAEEINNISGLYPESPIDKARLDSLWCSFKSILSKDYLSIVESFEQSHVWKSFCTVPAAKSIHHAYRFGLFEHSCSVTKIAYDMARHYVECGYPINIDVVVLGAMLHDIGKVFEFDVDASGSMVEKYTDAGVLLGHVFMGAGFLEYLIKTSVSENSPAKKDIYNELIHVLLSHHGEYEYGSPKKPKTLEALVVSAADLLDANMQAVYTVFSNEMDGCWTSKPVFSLHRAFYKSKTLDAIMVSASDLPCKD